MAYTAVEASSILDGYVNSFTNQKIIGSGLAL